MNIMRGKVNDLVVESMDFTKAFIDYQVSMRNVFDAVSRLQRMAQMIYDEGLITI